MVKFSLVFLGSNIEDFGSKRLEAKLKSSRLARLENILARHGKNRLDPPLVYMKQFFLWSKSIPSPIWGLLPPYHHSKMKSSIINRGGGGAVFQAGTQVLIDKLLCNSFLKLQISHMILRQLLWDIYIKWSKLFQNLTCENLKAGI